MEPTMKAKCPHCQALLDYYTQVGEETGWRCPECKGEIDPETIEKVEIQSEVGSESSSTGENPPATPEKEEAPPEPTE